MKCFGLNNVTKKGSLWHFSACLDILKQSYGNFGHVDVGKEACKNLVGLEPRTMGLKPMKIGHVDRVIVRNKYRCIFLMRNNAHHSCRISVDVP